MELDGITGAAANDGSKAAGSAARLADDFDQFLTLLTTQLQNQDPLEPMKSKEFTQQLVQFSGVEQQIQTNQNLETIAKSLSKNDASVAAGFLGNTARVEADTVESDGTGADWIYQLDGPARDVELQVKDENGFTVFQAKGNTSQGEHVLNWDGTNQGGFQTGPGTYTLSVRATDGLGDPVDNSVFVEDRITAVDTSNSGEPLFRIGGSNVKQDSILRLIAEGS
ncbi:flagellar hook assembly protein FlgD [Yunchengibacter salinarum]|uniref:flagellar hook assembly protein FlgD n=1 Tax=Yunchengibacter salinarum TaxID=3133399 RepID=UPI0035B6369E